MCLCKRIYIFVAIVMSHVRTDDTLCNVDQHPAWNIIDKFECGFSASDRIIGGMNAALGQFPWITRLGYYMSDEKEPEWLCGGALITDRYVLTAAHCVNNIAEDSELALVRIGEYDTSTNPDCQLYLCAPPVQDRKIKKVITHPSYDKPPFHNDLAIILLDTPVEINDYVLPICLPRSHQHCKAELSEFVTVAGWGKTNMTTEAKARILQYVSLPIVKPEFCDFFGKGFKLGVSQICAGGERNKDACVGDSGGPLMRVFDTPDGPKNFLLGVVSFGPTICGIKKPGVYTSIPYYLKWILNNIVS
ncbi:melanization protease 1-like [Vanessa cardui]|uniref:melanization protease 1-like n=1 Tax=Vanessa cardui TaxID=171605 RepID=UPI001F14313C|nr:melanization protease 1-like [Vanessa cardui]